MAKIELVKPYMETVYSRTGTKVQKVSVYDIAGMVSGFNKLITYGKNTQMAKLGCEQVKITHYKNGTKKYAFYNKDSKRINGVNLKPDGQVNYYDIVNANGYTDYRHATEPTTIGKQLKPFFEILKLLTAK